MKNDSLKKFVESHREELDYRQPSTEIWEKIVHSLFGGKSISLWNSVSLWRAAAVFLFGLTGYLFYIQNLQSQAKSPFALQEFRDIETYYSTQISEKIALISREDQFGDDSFTQDLQKLEAMYSVLSDELKKQHSEKVKDALVLNMLVRIDLLNQQIKKLEDSKQPPAAATSI